jgi:beta-glucosidase
MSMNSYQFYESAIAQAKSGKISMDYIDEAVRRILRVKFALGLFDENKKRLPREVIGSSEHIEVNRQLTRESMVLLENNGVLPLKQKPRRIAVIGPNADDIRAQYGDWTFFSHPNESPADCVPSSDYYTVLRGVQTVFPDSEVVYAKGCDIMEYSDDAMMEEAISIAKDADVVIAVLGDCLKQNGETKDRANLELSGRQNELVCRLKDTGKPIVTVLVNGKPLCIGEVVKCSDAVIEMFNGGDLGGLCAAELIAGKWNPSGKLPISFPRASAQIPCYYNTYPGWHGDRYMDVEKGNLYDFGYGLSFTTYAYSDVMLSASTAKAGEVLTVSVDVSNTGDMDGYETVQMYYNDRFSSVLTPEKQLCGFKKVFIKAGETVRVELTLAVNDLALIDPDEKTVLEPGIFDIMVGGNLQSLKTAELTVE